jgi:hypothetical protein
MERPKAILGIIIKMEKQWFLLIKKVHREFTHAGGVSIIRRINMSVIFGSHDNLSLEQIEKFEIENNVQLTDLYKSFLLKWNGGKVTPNLFMISVEQGPSVLNVFYGIGDMYDNLTDFIDIMDERLPFGFIPIGDDPSGNVICLGTKNPYYDKIYFWDHEQEPEDPNDMTNMYFLANNIDEFLVNLYEDPEE